MSEKQVKPPLTTFPASFPTPRFLNHFPIGILFWILWIFQKIIFSEKSNGCDAHFYALKSSHPLIFSCPCAISSKREKFTGNFLYKSSFFKDHREKTPQRYELQPIFGHISYQIL